MLKGYRTYIIAALVGMTGFLAEVDWVKIVDDPSGGIGFIVGGVVMAIMRSITTTPAGKKATDAAAASEDTPAA